MSWLLLWSYQYSTLQRTLSSRFLSRNGGGLPETGSSWLSFFGVGVSGSWLWIGRVGSELACQCVLWATFQIQNCAIRASSWDTSMGSLNNSLFLGEEAKHEQPWTAKSLSPLILIVSVIFTWQLMTCRRRLNSFIITCFSFCNSSCTARRRLIFPSSMLPRLSSCSYVHYKDNGFFFWIEGLIPQIVVRIRAWVFDTTKWSGSKTKMCFDADISPSSKLRKFALIPNDGSQRLKKQFTSIFFSYLLNKTPDHLNTQKMSSK